MSSSDSSYSPGDNLVSILWGCELSSAQSSFTFQVPEDSSYDQQLVLCSICVDAAARDEFHVVQVTSGDSRNRSPVTLATLKPSVQPTVALYGMELNPPVTFHLRAGSGPVCISGQHVALVQSSDEDEDDDDDEEEEEEELEEPRKRSGAQNGGAAKKWKLEQGNAGVGDPPRPRPRTQNSRIPPSLRSRSSRSPKAPLASRGRGAGRGRKAAAKQ